MSVSCTCSMQGEGRWWEAKSTCQVHLSSFKSLFEKPQPEISHCSGASHRASPGARSRSILFLLSFCSFSGHVAILPIQTPDSGEKKSGKMFLYWVSNQQDLPQSEKLIQTQTTEIFLLLMITGKCFALSSIHYHLVTWSCIEMFRENSS